MPIKTMEMVAADGAASADLGEGRRALATGRQSRHLSYGGGSSRASVDALPDPYTQRGGDDAAEYGRTGAPAHAPLG